MKISSKYVGTKFKQHRIVVSWRDTMNYAAAVDDNNARYFDDQQQQGIIAPPMFSVAATWQIVENLGKYIETEGFPLEILSTAVHSSEFLEFHAPIKPADELTIHGVIAAILPHRAGTYIVFKFAALDQHGQPVFTEYFAGIMRGVECVDGGAGAEALPAIPKAPKASSSNGWEQLISIDALRAHLYDGCADIHFPIHTSQRFARKMGLPGILLQGTATLAFAARELVNRNANGDPGRLCALGCRFSGMVFPGTDIRVQLLNCVKNGPHSDLFFRVVGDKGQLVIKDGYAKVLK
ncbi:MAG: MaoC family dehydratase N-terminal domain-containing protein [Xanthomonadales bacterium]|nr:MaoC family dehydratase N-terminal domain-containing protein [Xanthomonadales bacterium]